MAKTIFVQIRNMETGYRIYFKSKTPIHIPGFVECEYNHGEKHPYNGFIFLPYKPKTN